MLVQVKNKTFSGFPIAETSEKIYLQLKPFNQGIVEINFNTSQYEYLTINDLTSKINF